jgi:hypothetical protein
MEVTPLLVLLLVWWVFSLLTSGKRGQQRRQQRRPLPRQRPQVPAPGPAPAPAGEGGTQREGGRLEQILREFERAMEEAQQQRQPGPDADPGWETSEDWDAQAEEAQSLEDYEPQTRSMEEDFHRPEREVIVADAEAEAVHQRRLAWVEDRDRAGPRQDHRRVGERIGDPQVEEAGPGPVVSDRIRRLRQGIVWRELLGPPVALRDPADRRERERDF